jgi:hypothetical protein
LIFLFNVIHRVANACNLTEFYVNNLGQKLWGNKNYKAPSIDMMPLHDALKCSGPHCNPVYRYRALI